MIYTPNNIKEILSCNSIITAQDATISYLSTDTRTLLYPAETLFFAITTSTANGHKFVNNAYNAGVRNFVVSTLEDEFKNLENANFFIVDDSVKALQQIAAFHRAKFNIPVIGITGSNGKTIVKEWLYAALGNTFRITRSPKSYNSQIGVPLSVWELEDYTTLGIFEAGISEKGEMANLQTVIKPTIGILTNIGAAHSEGFASDEEKLNEKLLLFKESEVLIFKNDSKVVSAVKKINPSINLISWGFNDPTATVNITKVEKNEGISHISYICKGAAGKCNIDFTDDISLQNAIQCLVCGIYLGKKVNLENLEPIEMRLEVKTGINGCQLIDDAYSNDLSSLSEALNFMEAFSKLKFEKKSVIISDVAESGMDGDTLYSHVASLIRQKRINRVIAIGKEISLHKNLFPKDAVFFDSTDTFLNAGLNFANEIILIKGARKFHFEQISKHLEQKRHQTVMEVNLTALVHNFKKLRSYINRDTKAMAMIKADAYGCGALQVAQTLSHHHCDYFGVAVADEGVELRNAGISTNIIVMDPEPGTFDLLIKYNLEPEIYSFRMLEKFAAFTASAGIKSHPIHIKIDTGMHRLGFLETDMPLLVEKLKGMNGVKAVSAFSHLAAAEDPNEDEFTASQIEKFTRSTDYLKQNLNPNIIRHILNTSGVQRISDKYQFEMVRLGVGLYGVGLNEKSDIQNVATLKTIILQIKEIPANETVGYNRRGVLNRTSKIAAIPIGYADGLNRAFGRGNGCVLVNGKRAPFIGNICMDVCMIDITDIDGVKEGDEVTVFNSDLTISELAAKTGTIPYEILTSISKRVKRVYFSE
ncbi:MAG: bifunctional UDP-N-acetylmuramoyl-tripeptide:D-alanyl-D-alanine ligase/alanine racemase [Paludibacteraceae bacterium]|nr:bifunctional UDP-N-acetylmuramoyl-tripeptide:D-alanyl-D-alanine ligase/alanine racemase [Paludibacteraceae bacterium]